MNVAALVAGHDREMIALAIGIDAFDAANVLSTFKSAARALWITKSFNQRDAPCIGIVEKKPFCESGFLIIWQGAAHQYYKLPRSAKRGRFKSSRRLPKNSPYGLLQVM